MTWREFWGYIEHDRVMKTRLTVLLAIAGLGLATIVAAICRQWGVSLVCFVAMVGVAIAGYDA